MNTALLVIIITLQIIGFFINKTKKKKLVNSSKELDFKGRKTFKIISRETVNETDYYLIADVSNPKEPIVGNLSANDIFNTEDDSSSHGLSSLKIGAFYILSNEPISQYQLGKASDKIFAERILKS